MSAAPLLLVDNSNTRTKFTLAEGGAPRGDVRTLPTADIAPAALEQLLRGWQYSHAIICSVVPWAAAILRESLGCPCTEISADLCPELVRGYPQPTTLGADRIANAAAAAAHYALPCIAVDLGTACTFDVIVQQEGSPRFIGGVIAPGLPIMRSGLAERTALLPTADLAPQLTSAIGRSTRQAIQAGLLHGYRGMVQGIIRQLAAELPQPPCVVFTGGDAGLWEGIPDWAHVIDNSLTFKGMLSIYRTI